MKDLIELKTISGESIAINPRGITALISHGGMTEVYLYGAHECFLVEGDYWTVRDKLNQGEPTIPLSVIEKITTEIEERATYEGIYLDRADVLEIIGKAVKGEDND